MNIKNLFNFYNLGGISDTYAMSCSVYSNDGYACNTTLTDEGFLSKHDAFCVRGTFIHDGDVVVRTDTITNTSDTTLNLYDYKSRFCFPGEEYEVYTMYNNWQNESCGKWQDLHTTIEASAKGIRTNDCNVPMVAIYNKQTHRGFVFHVFPSAAWSIKISHRSPSARQIYTVVDIALNDDALDIPIDAGESFKLPDILLYEFTDKLSLNAPKMHRYMAKHYPRKRLPVIYNTWLSFFDRIELDNVFSQIDEAAKLGCDYFTLDAGWFGDGERWYSVIGSWSENTKGAYKGRMREVSDRVHAAGMKFGLWLEGERALKDAPIVQEHPEYFFSDGYNYYLNYAYAPAKEYITKLTIDLIEKYNIDFFKFDFNASISYDPSHKAFTQYHKNYAEYLQALRNARPDIYLECCAAGGYRTNLETMKHFDSYWHTDNQSVYGGTRIYKDAVYHILPSALEKWAALTVCDGFIGEYSDNSTTRLISTDNATWGNVISTTTDYLKGFFSGGIVGITSDLNKLDTKTKEELKKFIEQYKIEAPFWANASCRIIADTERLVAMQYENGNTVKIVVYTNIVTQNVITLFPVLESGTYTFSGETKTAEAWHADGFEILNPSDKNAYIVTFTKA